MKHILLSLALIPSSLCAEVYGNIDGCRLHANSDAIVSDSPIRWDAGAGMLTFHESDCDILSVTQIGSGAFTWELSCSGEGERWTTWYDVAVLAGDVYKIWPQAYPDMSSQLQLCE